MSSYDPLLPPEVDWRRAPSLMLPEEPSPEELAQFWTLSDLDRAEVIKCQGDVNQRRCAIQLCTLRTYARFLPEATPAPVAMTNMLQDMSHWRLREETLKAANAILVNFHHRLPISSAWGDGTVSSSDGQRFGLQASSLLGSLYPRYFGYYDQAL